MVPAVALAASWATMARPSEDEGAVAWHLARMMRGARPNAARVSAPDVAQRPRAHAAARAIGR